MVVKHGLLHLGKLIVNVISCKGYRVVLNGSETRLYKIREGNI